jgi:hypothetical protein
VDSLYKYLSTVDAVLSRTVKTGKVSVATNDKKRAPDLASNDLVEKIAANRQRVTILIRSLSAAAPKYWFDFYVPLLLVGHETLNGLADHLLRAWEYDPAQYKVVSNEPLVAWADVPKAMSSLMERSFLSLTTPPQDQSAHIAGLEWDLAIGPIHPFADACGRISRYFSALACMWFKRPLALHSSRDDYMVASQSGRAGFIKYWVSRPTVSV